ncbi:MAG: N-6 DNA methylase [bacterium]|nr:N-6 DNA methylase [bacterium]
MLKSTHKAITEYYRQRDALARQGVIHEMGVRSAFQMLLQQTAPKYGWTLVTEETLPKSRLRPDGTLKDDFQFRRGFWESKDEFDDLQMEIEAKTRKGYPITNTIFEDSREAVLFQNRREAMRARLDDARQLADLLNAFYGYKEPHIEDFEKAVDEFKERVPELAGGLLKKIEASYKRNAEFRAAFDGFFELCKTSLNPNIRAEAVKEMLVQHLLTERLIRNIFDNPEFRRRNVIASEVEKVIDALTGEYFNRQEFLDQLNRFYVAIERAAQEQYEFSEKQKFLNSIYERFFQGFSVKVADTHGIVYTPQPIVDFMCASVVEVLKTEFGKELGDRDVFIIDPCTGTGNFVVNLLHRFSPRDLPRVYRQQLFANEVMLMPYYIAALNIEHAYYELTGKYEPFEGLCFVDTLDLAEARQSTLGFMSEKNLERVERQRKAPITVVIGNPPYNTNQVNENDNNKNRKYEIVDRHIAETYARDSKATNRNKLGDPYVKFLRWSADRLEDRDGIVCFVTNNSFVEQIAFDGMRKHLSEDFSSFRHLNLHGNVYKNPKLSGTTHNVFGIKVGVGITIAVRKKKEKKSKLFYYRVPEFWRKEEKFDFLNEAGSVASVKWQRLTPDARHSWFPAEHEDEFAGFIPLGTKEAKRGESGETLFGLFSNGVKTNRDMVVYDFDQRSLEKRTKTFIAAYNAEVHRYQDEGMPEDIDAFVDYSKIDWSRDLKSDLRRGKPVKYSSKCLRSSLYRPFETMHLYFDSILNEEVYRWPQFQPNAESENLQICVSGIGSSKPFHALMTNIIPCLDLLEKTQCFPFYVYDEDGTNRRENITDWALQAFKEKYEIRNEKLERKKDSGRITDPARREKDAASSLIAHRSSLSKWDIFYYVYGLLHHPVYRARYADNLRRELPRIPFAPDFWAFSEAGRKLAELHLKYEELTPVWEDSGRDTVPARRESDSGHAGTHASAKKSVEMHAAEKKSVGTHAAAIRLVIDPKAKARDLWRVKKMKLVKAKDEGGRMKDEPAELKINDSITITGIPNEAFEYRLGNRSALEWVVDQYQVKTDKRSGIVSDPNRDDDPEYIVRLVGQVIRVSLDTVEIVNNLPENLS